MGNFVAKHRWVILAAGAAIQILTGIPAAWGVFQKPVGAEYGLSSQQCSLIFACTIAFFGIGCVPGGAPQTLCSIRGVCGAFFVCFCKR